MVTQFGFKSVDATNISNPDPVSATLYTLTPDGARPMISADWVKPIIAITLPEAIPFEVRRAFVCARDAMCYAYWYYPLLTLMAQQLLRVGDFATDVACRHHAIAPIRSFGRRVAKLLEVGVIPSGDATLWEGILHMRNHSTHPSFQEIWGPGMAIPIAQRVADGIGGMSWNAHRPDTT